MKRFKIQITFDLVCNGRVERNEVVKEVEAETKFEAILEEFASILASSEITNKYFGFLGKLEVKNLKAKYNNGYIWA